MYQTRVIVFLDILGFGQLVENSAHSPKLQTTIEEALTSILPAKLTEQDIVRLNRDSIPPEEFDDVRETAIAFSQAVLLQHPIAISFFSDSLVLSADSEDTLATQMILHTICSLSVRMWSDHHLTLRGGATIGQLHHVSGGTLFGPAMNEAYELESEKAVYPRILMTPSLLNYFRVTPRFDLMDTVLEHGDDYSFISIATCFRHLVTTSSWTLGADGYYSHCQRLLTELAGELSRIRDMHSQERIIRKYDWLINHAQQVRSTTPTQR